MANGLTEMVSKALSVNENEANQIIDEQASYCLDLMSSDGGLNIEDVEEAMMDMGVEPDYMDEFLLRIC